MSDFETVIISILIVVYGCVFYMAGKANLLDWVAKRVQIATKELEERLKDDNEEVK